MNTRKDIEQALAQSDMKAAAQATIKGYLSFGDYQMKEVRVWPGNEQAANRAGISTNTLAKYKKMLVAAGWIVDTGDTHTYHGNEMTIWEIKVGSLPEELSNKKTNSNFSKLNSKRAKVAEAKSRITQAIDSAARELSDDDLDAYLEGVLTLVGGVLTLENGVTKLSGGVHQTTVGGVTGVWRQRSKSIQEKNQVDPAAKLANAPLTSLESSDFSNNDIEEQSKEEDFANAQSSESSSSNNENTSDDLEEFGLEEKETSAGVPNPVKDVLEVSTPKNHEQSASSSTIEKEEVSSVELYENGVFRDGSNEEAWKLLEDVYPTMSVDKRFGHVQRIMQEVSISGGSVEEVATRLGHRKLVAAFEW